MFVQVLKGKPVLKYLPKLESKQVIKLQQLYSQAVGEASLVLPQKTLPELFSLCFTAHKY